MKKLLIFIAFCFSFFISFSQAPKTPFPINQGIGATNTLVTNRGGLKSDSAQVLPAFLDTIHANYGPHPKYYAGNVIRTGDSIWMRNFNATRWILVSNGTGAPFSIDSSKTTISVLNDSTVIICNGAGVCDTFHFTTSITNISSVSFISDSSFQVCGVDTVTAVITCDTIIIPKQPINVYQNGVNSPSNGIVEFGTDLNKPQTSLVHNTVLNTNFFVQTFRGQTVYDYPYQFYQRQSFANSTGLTSFLSQGADIGGQIDFGNTVRLGVNYTSDLYGGTLPGYMGFDKIGYFITVNGVGNGSSGFRPDNPSSKFSALLFNTLDTANRDVFTFYGKHPPNTFGAIAPISVGGTLAPYEIMALNDTGDVRLHHYPSTRNNGGTPKALFTDVNGNVKLGTITTGSTVTILDSAHIEICNTNSCDTITITTNVFATFVQVINDSTLLVCDSTFNCDTVNIPQSSFDRGRYDPNQASFANTLHNANGNSLEEINNGFYHEETTIGFSGNIGEVQQTNANSIISNIDSTGNGAYAWINYFAGFPYPQFQLNSTWDVNNTQITGTAQSLTFNQNSGQYFIQNVQRGAQTDSVLSLNTTTNQIRYKSVSALVNANEGLIDSSGYIQLGGPSANHATILNNRFIELGASTLQFNANGGANGIWVRDSGVGNAVVVTTLNTNGTAFFASTTTGNGNAGLFTSIDGNGVKSTSNGNGIPGTFIANPASTNTIVPVMLVQRSTSGTAADGIGGSIDFYTETSGGSPRISNQAVSKFTTANDGTRMSQLDIIGINNTATNTIMSAYGTGVVGIGISSAYTGTRLEVVDNSVGAGTMAYFHSSNTNAASNAQIGVLSALAGANASGGQQTFALYGQNSHTGSGTNFSTVGVSSGGSINIGVFGVTGSNSISSLVSAGVLGYASTGGTYGVYGQHVADGGIAILGEVLGAVTSGIGVQGSSAATFGIGVRGGGTTGVSGLSSTTPVEAQNNSSSNNDEKVVLRAHRTTETSGNFGTNGIGGIIDFATFAGNSGAGSAGDVTSGQLVSKWTTATYASRSALFIIRDVINAVTDDALKLGDYVTLTESSATTFATTTVPASKIGGGYIVVTITADDASNFQSRTMRLVWTAVNKAGTTTISISTPEEVVAVSSGTLTATITAVDAGSGVINFQANAVSSLSQTTLRCSYQMSKNF